MLVEWIVKEKLSRVFNSNPQGRRQRGRPKTDGGTVYTHIFMNAIYKNGKKGEKQS
jgi:hypothetical protein